MDGWMKIKSMCNIGPFLHASRHVYIGSLSYLCVYFCLCCVCFIFPVCLSISGYCA
uniref:Uncharacterized protein n=1 Tax=Anguilla anguilla TaxID=7936 RepID=A0A0E9R0F8_ANGAN